MKKSKVGIAAVFLKVVPKVLSIAAKVSKAALVGISFAAYAYVYSWQFAVIIISMLIVHEYGHIWAMQRCGIKTKGIYLIPFVGGLAVSDGMAKTRWDEVYIAMMGPVFGFALSLVSMVIYYITRDPLFAACASWMAFVNILNLFPVSPLDGGRVLKSVTLSLHNTLGLVYMAGALLLLILGVIFLGLWTLLVLLIIGLAELYFEYQNVRLQKALDEFDRKLDLIKAGQGTGRIDLIDESISISADDVDDARNVISKYRTTTTPMDKLGCVKSMVWYVITLASLYMVMELMNHEPGAAVAMEMLR